MDFGGLPPEINSARMYSGPGSGPLLAAAAAWDGVAAELRSTASSYASVLSGLTGPAWSGPAAAAMSAAAQPFAAWLSTSAARAEEAAVAARGGGAAYDTAFDATVPPPVIAANRSLLAALIAANIFGQNAAAIAAAELHYGEMWAQDAAAMYGYAGSSASVVALTPFAPPPPTTNPAGAGAQSAAVTQASAGAQSTLSQLMAMLPQALQGLAVSGPVAALNPAQALPVLDFLAGPLSPVSLYGIGGVPYLLAIQCILLPMNGSNVVAALTRADKMTTEGTWPPNPFDPGVLNLDRPVAGAQLAGASGPAPSARLGSAGSVGRLSVPQGWTAATPIAKTVAAVLPEIGPEAIALAAANTDGAVLNDLALGGLAGRALGATGGVASHKIAGATGSVAASKPSTATIIVIPPSARD